MELKRVCAFLVAAFLVVDVFLLVLCIHLNDTLLYLSGDMIDNAVSYVRSQNTAIEPEVIRRKIPDNAVYTFQTANTELAMTVASKLADTFFDGAPVSFVETPDGVSYTVGKSTEVAASFRVYTDSFRFEYTTTAFDRETLLLPSEAFSSADLTLSDRQKKGVAAFIEALNAAAKSTKASYTLCGKTPADGGSFVSLSQNVYADYPVVGMFVNLYVSEDGNVLAACGNRIFASLSRSYAPTLTDGLNAVYALDFSSVAAVQSERIVYTYRYAGGATHYLVPVWEIVYLDRDNHTQTLYVDSVKK